MTAFESTVRDLVLRPKTWLVTGVAGFIGSNLLQHLLLMNQRVVGLDNFSTGFQANLDEVASLVSKRQWSNFNFHEGDIRDYGTCKEVMRGADYVLHQAALGSVPRSIADPLASNDVNVSGFLNVLQAAKDLQVKSLTYAASSSTYGDHTALPKKEDLIGRPLSPYAVSKYVNELYAEVYSKVYGFKSIGLRYFNVFGPRQDPNGAYAAVIPKWTSAILKGEQIYINGDGETSRDFCFVENAVQMNILAATTSSENKNEVYNVAVGERTSLGELFVRIRSLLGELGVDYDLKPMYRDFRNGDVRHSQADVSKARVKLGYTPRFRIVEGIGKTVPWYLKHKENI